MQNNDDSTFSAVKLTPTDVCPLPGSVAITPIVPTPVQRYQDQAWGAQQLDLVSNEIPVALVFNGISHTVMMATPQDLEHLALGFALSEGILESPDECYGIDVVPIDAKTATNGLTPACEVRLEVSARRFTGLKEHRRTLAGRTGCGVCGVESLSAFELDTPQVQRPAWVENISAQQLMQAFNQLPQEQVLNQQTGSVHAAGWVTPQGKLIKTMEDVGRHNALDKLLGWRATEGKKTMQNDAQDDAQNGFVIMTSRASYELIRKCAFSGSPILATISAPTALAIAMAKQAHMRLYGLCRKQQVVQYTD